jgi:hypothetical protein
LPAKNIVNNGLEEFVGRGEAGPHVQPARGRNKDEIVAPVISIVIERKPPGDQASLDLPIAFLAPQGIMQE